MYQRILVPINTSSTSERALQEAIKIAAGKAHLHLVYVLEEIFPVGAEGYDYANSATLREAERKIAEDTLAKAAEKVRQSGATVAPFFRGRSSDIGAEDRAVGYHPDQRTGGRRRGVKEI